MNPDAMNIAKARNREYSRARRAGKCPKPGCFGPLYGIPIILKDNVAADPMNNTAGKGARFFPSSITHWCSNCPAFFAFPGSFALLGCKVKEAFLTTKLKKAGAIILAKAGLSEWANYRGRSVSGWSGRNGQVFVSFCLIFSCSLLDLTSSRY